MTLKDENALEALCIAKYALKELFKTKIELRYNPLENGAVT